MARTSYDATRVINQVQRNINHHMSREGLTTAVPKLVKRHDSALRIPTKPDFGSTSKRKFTHRRWEDPIELPSAAPS